MPIQKGSHRQDKESVPGRLKYPPKKAADYQKQKTVKSKEQDRLSFFAILNNFLMINAKECIIIDSWHIVKNNLFF